MNAGRSFREYVDLLKAENEIVEVTKEVDWRYEMSAVTRRVYDLHAPAPLFFKYKGLYAGGSGCSARPWA